MLSGALMGSQAVARDANGFYATNGVKSCAIFLQEFEKKSWGQIAIQAWLAGYITAHNSISPRTYQILGNSDLLGAELWVKNFCEKNPLKNLADAAESLMFELFPSRQIKAPN